MTEIACDNVACDHNIGNICFAEDVIIQVIGDPKCQTESYKK